MNKTDHHKREKKSSLWRLVMKRLIQNKVAMTGLSFLLFIFVVAFIGPFFSPYQFSGVDPPSLNDPPGSAPWVGTELVDRDVLTRLLLAARITLTLSSGPFSV